MGSKITISLDSQVYTGVSSGWQSSWPGSIVSPFTHLSMFESYPYMRLCRTAPLAAHLEKENVEFMQFAFRWMNCLLMREISVENTVRMWDTYLVRTI